MFTRPGKRMCTAFSTASTGEYIAVHDREAGPLIRKEGMLTKNDDVTCCIKKIKKIIEEKNKVSSFFFYAFIDINFTTCICIQNNSIITK